MFLLTRTFLVTHNERSLLLPLIKLIHIKQIIAVGRMIICLLRNNIHTN